MHSRYKPPVAQFGVQLGESLVEGIGGAAKVLDHIVS